MSATTTTPDNPEPTMNREAWLSAAADLLWPLVTRAGGTRPAKFRVSCGWPSKSALRRASSSSRRIGEAWSEGSEDGTREVFISPALAHPMEVLDVLLHELIHAALPADAGHGPVFQRVMKGVGLKGKPTATFVEEGTDLFAELEGFTRKLRTYPHAKLDADLKPKQRARLMKGECPDCGYIVRLTRVWIDHGMPTCPCGSLMESVEYEAEGEPLTLAESHVSYLTEDGVYRLQTSKRAGRQGKWYVIEQETSRLAIRANRDDALAFIAAVRAGETDFPEHGAEAADEFDFELAEEDFEDVGDWSDVEGEYLGEDEDELADNPDGDLTAEEALAYAEECEARERSGARKSASIAAGEEEAMD